MRVRRHAVRQPVGKSYRLIPLTKGQNAIVDVRDFRWLSQWNWYAAWMGTGKGYYAAKGSAGKRVFMHRLILGCGIGEEGDHWDGNGLNNRRYNLRRCTHKQNCRNQKRRADNTSGYKGVHWDKQRGKWSSMIMSGGVGVRLGFFSSKVAAARAYDSASRRYHGEFARLNFSGGDG